MIIMFRASFPEIIILFHLLLLIVVKVILFVGLILIIIKHFIHPIFFNLQGFCRRSNFSKFLNILVIFNLIFTDFGRHKIFLLQVFIHTNLLNLLAIYRALLSMRDSFYRHW